MTLNQLNPIIESWIDSDEFIDSVISIAQEFALLSTTPLIEVTFGLITKIIKPEEFKTRLLASLPPDKQNEAIISKFVHALLLPIKEPLAESGVDISTITSLDETLSSPYVSPLPEITTEIITLESLSAPLDEIIISPSVAPETLTNSVSSKSSAASINTDPTSSYSATSFQNTPNDISDPTLVSLDISNTSPVSSDITPVSLIKTTPSPFSPSLDAPTEPIPTNEQIPTNNSHSTPIPFVIHKEKVIERTSQSLGHTKELLRPLFYSKQIEKEEPPSFANLEFKLPENNDNKNS